jgi:uncharacterized membrane protein YfcA
VLIYFLTILTGIGAGIFAGMFGIGGGIVILPVLMLCFGWSMTEATATSLTALLLPTNSIALFRYKKSNLLYIRGSLLVAFGMVVGNWYGATQVLSNPSPIWKELFGVYQILIGLKYAKFYKLVGRKFFNKAEIKEETFKSPDTISWYIFVFIGILAGITAGMFGIGGGVVITTILISLLKVETKQAVAMSLGAMFLPVAFFGVYQYYNQGYVDVIAAVLIAVGIEIGSAFSSKIVIKLENSIYRQLFGWALVVIGIYFVLESML